MAQIDTSTFAITTGSASDAYPYTDTYAEADAEILRTKNMLAERAVWTASRKYDTETTSFKLFCGNFIFPQGRMGNDILYAYHSSYYNNYTPAYGVRPVVVLRSGIQLSGGDGTEESPYTLQ